MAECCLEGHLCAKFGWGNKTSLVGGKVKDVCEVGDGKDGNEV